MKFIQILYESLSVEILGIMFAWFESPFQYFL